MRSIISFVDNKGKVFVVSSNLSSFIYSSFYIFCTKNGLDLYGSKEVIIAESSLLMEWKDRIENLLSQLIESCYHEPNKEEIQFNPNRFEEFYFKNISYKVNYRVSPNGFGLLAYSVFLLLEYLNDIKSLKVVVDFNE